MLGIQELAHLATGALGTQEHALPASRPQRRLPVYYAVADNGGSLSYSPSSGLSRPQGGGNIPITALPSLGSLAPQSLAFLVRIAL